LVAGGKVKRRRLSLGKPAREKAVDLRRFSCACAADAESQKRRLLDYIAARDLNVEAAVTRREEEFLREIEWHVGPLGGSGEWWLGQITRAVHTVVTGLRDGLRDSPRGLPFEEEPPCVSSREDSSSVDSLLADEPRGRAL